MTATEQQFIDTIRKCKTNINNMYWGFLLSKQQKLQLALETQVMSQDLYLGTQQTCMFALPTMMVQLLFGKN